MASLAQIWELLLYPGLTSDESCFTPDKGDDILSVVDLTVAEDSKAEKPALDHSLFNLLSIKYSRRTGTQRK